MPVAVAEEYLETLDLVGDRFAHCLTVSAMHMPDEPTIYVNAAFERQTGWSRTSVIGKNLRFLQGELGNQPARGALRGAISENKAVFTDIVNFCWDGTPFMNRLIILPFDYLSGPGERYFLGLQRVIAMPENSGVAQSVAHAPRSGEIEHEINNPLAVALGLAELKRGNTDAVDAAILRLEHYVDAL